LIYNNHRSASSPNTMDHFAAAPTKSRLPMSQD
jgi:hypothetical protein